MAGYAPLKITGNSTGLVQQREEFILPDDAYPVLQNAYVWRERIKRKKGFELLGRLQRNIGMTDGSGDITIVIDPHPIQIGISQFVIGTDIFTDPGGASPVTLLTNSLGATHTLDRATGILTITGSIPATAVQYFPGLPVMGIRTRELQNSAVDQTVFFDQDYAYVFDSPTNQFKEFIPGTTWNAANIGVSGTNFFWSTNYWVSGQFITNPPAYKTLFTTVNRKLFWVTNNSGAAGVNADPPRITDGVDWMDFYHDTTPAVNSPWAQIDATTFLTNWLAMLPFRGRMVVFNTWEGTNAANSKNSSNRIRWATIGNPFIPYTNGPPATGSWRDDIRGQGGFLDIPTSEDIISVGFVRDNLVIYCERSTWQLRYTGRTISPFQIEKVNSELGAQSPFSLVQFDTSLFAIGNRGIIECDSYKAERIDVKIPDFVFEFNAENNGQFRIQGIRDFVNRLAYFTIPYAPQYSGRGLSSADRIFPNIRLVYNYENDSWATFTDSLTTLGNYQAQKSLRWIDIHSPWIKCNFPWIVNQITDPIIAAGNQQGFVLLLDRLNSNDSSLFITNLTQNSTVRVTSPNHNLSNTTDPDDFVLNIAIGISGIIATTPFSSLNGGIYGINVKDKDNFDIYAYNPVSGQFETNVVATPSGTYSGGGLIDVRENFSINSKKFNFLDEGQNIQLGFIDILMQATDENNAGAITLNVYIDYDDENPSNIKPQNQVNGATPPQQDTFFNSTIPTSRNSLTTSRNSSKFWQRVFCATRGNFLTLEYTLSNAQLNGIEQECDVQIDAQILWIRKAGRMTAI